MRYLGLMIGLLILGCQPGERVEALAPAQQGVYALCQAPSLPKGIRLNVRLDTTAAGKLILSLKLHNTRSTQLQLQLSKATLLTDDQRPQEPLLAPQERILLLPNEETDIRLHYQPVNDVYLHQRTGLQGPFQQEYRLPLSFIEEVSDTLAFCFSQQAYLQYRQRAELKKPLLYRPTPMIKTREAAARQELYWQSLVHPVAAEEGAAAYFTDQEFFSAGVNLQHSLYAVGDSLYLKLYLINHAPLMLEITPAAIWLQTRDRVYEPVRLLGSRTGGLKEQRLLKRGDQLPLQLVYTAPQADSLLLRLQGIQLHGLQLPLFREDFMYLQE